MNTDIRNCLADVGGMQMISSIIKLYSPKIISEMQDFRFLLKAGQDLVFETATEPRFL